MREGSVSRRVGGLKLRATASTRGDILDKLSPGASLEVGELRGKWYAVRVVKTGKRGFVYAPDVEFPAILTAPPVDKPVIVSAPVAAPPQPIPAPVPAISPAHPIMPPPDHPTLFQGGVWMAVAVFVIAVGWLLYWLTR